MTYTGPERREMSPLTKEDIKEIIEEAVSRHTDSDQHQWIKSQIAKEQRKQELWEKIKAQAIGTGVIAVSTYFVTLFWQDIIKLFARH